MLRALLSGPGLIILLPLLYFRFRTMRYRFDEEGVHMRWGLLFRREINLTYARIQDIHLRSGLLQRWIGLADVQVQTAASSAAAEMTIEGLVEFEGVRDFLYSRMRGHGPGAGAKPAAAGRSGSGNERNETELVIALRGVAEELRRTREALERVAPGGGSGAAGGRGGGGT